MSWGGGGGEVQTPHTGGGVNLLPPPVRGINTSHGGLNEL